MVAEPSAQTPRERYRTQLRAEIKQHAWEQIGTAGASGLSLNAIAKQLGMSGPALYRYFAGRDELITELIRDAYQSLADTFAAVAAATPADAPGPDPAALADALRDWALADPQRYFLIYGTPVPGYRAPDDITAIAQTIMATLLDACTAVPSPPDHAAPASAARLEAHLADHRAWAGDHPAPPPALRRALALWSRLHGVLSLELAGHYGGMGFDPALLFTAELDALS
jgi:AcrR family transcriptional regulator